MFPSTSNSSRETSGLLGKQNYLFPSGSDIKCIISVVCSGHLKQPEYVQSEEIFRITFVVFLFYPEHLEFP